MKIASVIAEFNPLHNAHEYILNKTKEEGYDLTAVILGGNFMQRGEASVMDCYERAKTAVKCGADVVLLLPYIYSAQTAEIFAWGGVNIADKIDSSALFFGSENDTLPFYDTAKLLCHEPEEYKAILKRGLDFGLSYANARENAVKSILGEDAAKCLTGANNILSTEYTKSIIRLESSMKPYSVKRLADNLSATKIREILAKGNIDEVKNYIPKESFEILTKNKDKLKFQRDFEKMLLHTLLIKGKDGLIATSEIEDGLENRIYANRYALNINIDEFTMRTSSKRYTKSRIRRILYNCLMGYNKDTLTKAKNHSPSSAIALCANEKGREFIKSVNKKGEFKIISNLSKEMDRLSGDKWIYEYEIKAYDIYHQNENISLLKKHCEII